MQRYSVLVIDDSLTIRGIIESVLERDGRWDLIGPASDIAEARILIEQRRPDVITLDLSLPDIGGLEFLDELRDVDHPPVIVLSSSTREHSSEAAEASARGAFASFDKARLVSDAPRLMRILRKAVERSRRTGSRR